MRSLSFSHFHPSVVRRTNHPNHNDPRLILMMYLSVAPESVARTYRNVLTNSVFSTESLVLLAIFQYPLCHYDL
jgi:hypothetical protein